MSYTSAQIIEQNKTFYEAYKAHKISYEQYVQAAKFQNQALKDAYAREGKTAPQAQQPKVSSRATFMPPEPGTPQYALQGSYAQQGSTVYTAEGEKVGVVGSPNMPALTPGESYQVEPPQPPVKQQDLGIATQMDIAFQLGIKTAEGLISQQSNPVLREIAKAELNYAVAPILGGVAGGAATLESNIYGSASLVKSAVVSVQSGKLQYAPVKTPVLAPTVLGGATGLLLGNSQEARQINEKPGLYGVGYGYGSAFTEVGLATIEGVGIGFVAGKASNVLRTVVNPRVNQFAESTLARSKLVAQTGLNRVSPGLGVKAEIVYNRDVARVASKLNSVDASLTGRANAARLNVKYGLTEPLKEKVGFAYEKASVKVANLTPKTVKEAKLYSKSVVAPNLAEYGKPFKSADLNLAPIRNMKAVGRQVLKAEPIRQNPAKPFINNPIRNAKSEIAQVIKAERISPNKIGLVDKPVRSTKIMGWNPNKGVTSNKNISTNQALDFATKQKSSLRGPAYENTLKLNEPNNKLFTGSRQVTRQVQRQSSKIVGASVKSSSKLGVAISGAPSLVRAYPGTQRSRVREELEIVSLPRSKADLKVTKEADLQEADLRLTPNIRLTSGFSGGKTGSGSSFVRPKLIPSPARNNRDIIIPAVRQPQTQIIIPDIGQPVTPKTVSKTPPPNDVPNKLKIPQGFGFRVGGGSGGGGGSSTLKGKWRKVDNPVKSINAMLKTFGIKNSNRKQSISRGKRRSKR